MRPIWSGAISFGLVNIPVNLVSALTHKEIHFHFLHKKCGTRLVYQKHCPKCDLDLSWEEIERAYEHEKGKYVSLSDRDFEKVDVKLTRSIEIQQFVDAEEINPLYYSHPYYLLPGKLAESAYFLFHEAMLKTKKIALGKLIIKDREHLVIVKPEGVALLCEVLHYAEEIIEPKVLGLRKKEIERKELELAKGLIFVLSKKVDLRKFKDEYQAKLTKMVKKKVKGEKIIVAPPPKPTRIEELMSALKESMRLVRAQRE